MAGFDPSHVKRYFPALKEVAQRLADRWTRAARRHADIELQSDLMRYTVDTIAGLAFGAKVNTLESDGDVIQKHLDKIFPAIFKRLFAPLPLWRWVRTSADRQLAVSIGEVMAAVNGFVAQARERLKAQPELRENPGNLLEAMIAAADQPDSGMDDKQVAGNVLTMLLAGEDTTANTLAWLCYLLAETPDAQRAVQEEADTVLGARMVADDAPLIDALRVTEAATREAMRLKPVAPLLTHESNEAVVVSGIELRARTPIATLLRPAGLDPALFPEPNSFRPARWLDPSLTAERESGAKRVLMPFGAGPRFCPGRHLAMQEILMVTAMMMKSFSIERDTGSQVRERFALSMMPEGFRARLRLR